MKKILMIALCLTLSLSLCACGASERYGQLADYLDGGDLEGAKQEIARILPEFRAEQEKAAADAEVLQRYGDVIKLLEAQDYEGAVEAVQSRIPQPAEPVYTEVPITLDNWQDYFEIQPCSFESRNVFGELEAKEEGYGLYLREEYLPLLKRDYSGSVSFKVQYDCEYREYDEERFCFVEGGRIEESGQEELIATLSDWREDSNDDSLTSSWIGKVCAPVFPNKAIQNPNVPGTGYYKGWIVEMEIVDVTGSIYLAD